MKAILRLLTGLGLLAAFVEPLNAGTDIKPERLDLIMRFAAEGLDVSPDVPPPRIVYKSFEWLQASIYGNERISGTGPDKAAFFAVSAMYNFDHHELRLVEGVDYSRPENEWIVVHEVVHYLQDVYHKTHLDQVQCLEELEVSAYRISNMWVIVTGHGHVKSVFMVQCDEE